MAASKKPAKAKTSKPIFDVAKPGAPVLPSAPNSRSVIIKHPTIKDPMVNHDPTPEPAKETAPVMKSPSSRKVVIQPLHQDVTPTSKPEPVAAPIPEVTVEEPIVQIKESAPEVVDEPVDTQPEVPKAEPKPVVEAEKLLPDEAKEEASTDAPTIDDAPLPDRSELIEKLVASEEYFLPIETIEQRRSKRAAIFGTLVIVVLLAALYNVMLDASILPNTFNVPHTRFFTISDTN